MQLASFIFRSDLARYFVKDSSSSRVRISSGVRVSSSRAFLLRGDGVLPRDIFPIANTKDCGTSNNFIAQAFATLQ